ncbi:hypothetical protein C0991_006552 [Blastosporella zonata]|nr:hypothetical protein C0991_006552 [Blastosporella zonata]
MPTPSDNHKCSACDAPTKNRCAGCSREWYCSKRCQKEHWPVHIFECKITKPIKTSYYLAQAARRDLVPDDTQTLKDYGFERAVTPTEKCRLLGLYQGLFSSFEVHPKVVNGWLVEGTLVKEIKAAFQKRPAEGRGDYYPWFLANQHILDISLPIPKSSQDHLEDAFVRAWRFTGRSTEDSLEDIKLKISHLPHTTQTCYFLYTALLMDLSHPNPSDDTWVVFGFCTCRDMHCEGQLGVLYHQLIERCTFTEFVWAYEHKKLLKLIDSRGLRDNSFTSELKHLEDVLATPMVKSVWYLKQFVEVNEPDFQPHASVSVDYGLRNCQSDTEYEELRVLYKHILDMPGVNPLELHEACIEGKLFEFVERFVTPKKKVTRKQWRRILKNPYPLPAPLY